MEVTAIIQRYYPERLAYIKPILESLASQTVKPARVILWNNFEYTRDDPEYRNDETYRYIYSLGFHGLDVHDIYSSRNSLMGRYAAVLLAETPYVYIQDDDLVMGPETIERLLEVSERHFGALVGPFGMNFGADPEKPYTSGRRVLEGECDIVLGRCYLASRKSLITRLCSIANLGRLPMGRCDDLLISMANLMQPVGVVPGISFTNLDERGHGLSHEPQHMDERNAMAARLKGELHLS